MKDRNALAAALASLVGDEELERAARESGFVVRQRKVQVVALFWTLVLGMQTMRVASLSGLQRLYHELTETVLASASFQERFTPPMVAWLRAVFEMAASRLADERPNLKGPLATFSEVTLIDSTVRRLHASLAARFPGNRTNHSPAALKVNVRYDLRGGRIASATIAPETRSETRFLDPSASCSGQLLIFDLGVRVKIPWPEIGRSREDCLASWAMSKGRGSLVVAYTPNSAAHGDSSRSRRFVQVLPEQPGPRAPDSQAMPWLPDPLPEPAWGRSALGHLRWRRPRTDHRLPPSLPAVPDHRHPAA